MRGARYVITQLRVGGMQTRRKDEYLGQRHGLIGQETTGVGGMAKALRTIPAILNLVRDIRELAPNALLVNFTNPSGLVTEALNRYASDVSAVGVCNAPITTKMGILQALEERQGVQIAPERHYPADKTDHDDHHREQTKTKLQWLHTRSQTAPASAV